MRLREWLSPKPIALLAAILVFVCSMGRTATAQGDGNDPSDIWYRGFLLVQTAKDLQEKKDYLGAFNKLGEAQPLYDYLATNVPDYQPQIVKERRHLIASTREDLKQLMNRPTPVAAPPAQTPQAAPVQQPVPRVAIAPPPVPGYGADSREIEIEPYDGEVALPSWNDGASNALPRVAAAPGMPRVQTGRPASVGAIANSLHEDLKKKDSLIEWLNQKNDELKRSLIDRENAVAQAKAEVEMARKERDRALRQQAQSGGEGLEAENKRLRAALNDSLQQLERANQMNVKLVAELDESKREMGRVRARMEELTREKDSLLQVVNGGDYGGSALKELMDRNRTLTAQLDRAEQLASSLSQLSKEKDDDIAFLKSEISKIQVERDTLISENQRHQQSIDALQRKLELLSDGLTADEKNALAQATPTERRENELLRSMVLKQLRRQAQMKQAKEILLGQLEKLGGRSDTLLGLVEDMAQGSQLTAEEKALFRAPQFQEIVEAASRTADTGKSKKKKSGATMLATLVAPGNGKGPEREASEEDVIKNQKVTVELSQIDKAARLDFKEGRLSEAEDGFLEYLRFRPKSVSCLCNLGVLKIAMKNYSESEYFLNKALAIDNSSGLANYLLGRTYFLQNKLDQALEKLEIGITHDPQNAKAHNCVGVISTRKGWVARAERAFTNAVSIDPEYGDAHFNLAVLHATKDQPDAKSAEKHYFRALHLGIPRDATIETFLDESSQTAMTIGTR